MSTNRRPECTVSVRYVAEILQLHAIPLLAAPGAVFQHDTTRLHAANYTTVLHQQHPNPFLALSPGFNPVWQSNTSGRSWMDVFKAEWMLLQKYASFSRHFRRSGWSSQCRWFTAGSSPCLDVQQLLILKGDIPLMICMLPSHKKLINWLDKKNAETMNFDLNQLQN